MGSGEKRSRTKATPEVIKLIENAMAYFNAHRSTTRPFERCRVRDAVADILGVGVATVARVESGKLKAQKTKPDDKPGAKKSCAGRPALEHVAMARLL